MPTLPVTSFKAKDKQHKQATVNSSRIVITANIDIICMFLFSDDKWPSYHKDINMNRRVPVKSLEDLCAERLKRYEIGSINVFLMQCLQIPE